MDMHLVARKTLILRDPFLSQKPHTLEFSVISVPCGSTIPDGTSLTSRILTTTSWVKLSLLLSVVVMFKL